MWNPINERIGYCKGSVNQGIVKGNTGAIVIDTGLDKQAARKILRLLNELGTTPVAIINTHAHADHFGGNEEMLQQYGDQIKVYAPVFEETAIRHPIWEPSYLYGGAYPLTELQNKFLFAPPSRVDVVFDAGTFEVDGVQFEAIPLYGHSYRQMGIGINHVLFAADGFYGLEVLAKHPIPFHVDTKETLATLHRLVDLPYEMVVPGHGSMVTSYAERKDTMKQNQFVYERVNQLILDALKEPKTIDQLHATISLELGINATNAGSFLLYRTAIQSLLKYLLDEKQVIHEIKQNQWLWQLQISSQ